MTWVDLGAALAMSLVVLLGGVMLAALIATLIALYTKHLYSTW